MRKEIQISIPEPCHEDWTKMTQEEKGRHCKICEKTVFDFTNKTDEYIIKTFEDNNNLCGRFKDQQLNRPVAYSRKEKNSLMSYVASGVLAFLALGTNKVEAQGKTKVVQTETPEPQIMVLGKVAPSVLNYRIISGNVFGKDNNRLQGVNVQEKGTANSVITDANGNYTIKVSKEATLVFSALKHKTTEIKIAHNNHLSIKMLKKTNIDLITIKGVVLDENELPLPTATVMEKGTTNGVSTDFDGNFEMQVKLNSILQISYIGYESKEVQIEKQDNLNIRLNIYPDLIMGELIVERKSFSVYEHLTSIEKPKQKIIIGGALTKKAIRKYSRNSKRILVRAGLKERTSVGHLLYKMTTIFRKKKQA